jgi:hypothetical protein
LGRRAADARRLRRPRPLWRRPHPAEPAARVHGTPTLELAWYLALNCARLPHGKEDAIEAYRSALEAHGVATAGWFERALDLALLTGLVWFGWEKALGGPGTELDWWLDRAHRGLAWL